jgi:DNA-binding transcriptional LysR family regulator
MNLTSLRYLVALSEYRHFARAAQACHITQPALSNALRALEKEFGTPIVKRARSYAGLTPEGERVLGAARRMLNEHALLQQELAAAGRGADCRAGGRSLCRHAASRSSGHCPGGAGAEFAGN